MSEQQEDPLKGLIERIEKGEVAVDGRRLGLVLRLASTLVHLLNMKMKGDPLPPPHDKLEEVIAECEAALALCAPERDNEMLALTGLLAPQLRIILDHLQTMRTRTLEHHEVLPLTAAMAFASSGAHAVLRSELLRFVREARHEAASPAPAV